MILLNMIEWSENMDNAKLFDIVLPDKIDRKTCIDTIVYDNHDLDLYCSDYHVFKYQVHNFFKKKFYDYECIVNALTEDYNPIHNYDRYEVRNEQRNNSYKSTNRDTGNSTDEYQTSAFNSDSYQPKDKSTNSTNRTDIRDTNEDNSYTTDNHLFGNIGVTTSQQMIESEMELRSKHNIYNIISMDFRKEFCLTIM